MRYTVSMRSLIRDCSFFAFSGAASSLSVSGGEDQSFLHPRSKERLCFQVL